MKVVAENPRNVEARLLLLNGFMAIGDMPQATALANDLLKTNADSPAVQTAVGTLATMKKDDGGGQAGLQPRTDGRPARILGARRPAQRRNEGEKFRRRPRAD